MQSTFTRMRAPCNAHGMHHVLMHSWPASDSHVLLMHAWPASDSHVLVRAIIDIYVPVHGEGGMLMTQLLRKCALRRMH
jgi:hypothetical protein